MSDTLYAIDISKCPIETRSREIRSILETTMKNAIQIKVSPSRGMPDKDEKPPFDYLSVREIAVSLYVVLEKRSSSLTFDLFGRDNLEILIDSPTVAYFFPAKVKKLIKEADPCIFSINYPRKLYRISRRDYFRYCPEPEFPIMVSFVHNNIPYKLYVNDISGSGLSVNVPFDKKNRFYEGDKIKELKIIFKNKSVEKLSAKIIRKKEIEEKHIPFCNLGFFFLNLHENMQDAIIKNIFDEHREFLKRIQDRYALVE